MELFLAVLVGLVVGLVLGHVRAPAYFFQNQGEAKLSAAVKRRFVPPDYHLLNHVTLRLKHETTQIDHVLVSRFGVFVIETKDFNGWLFANSEDRYWTQVLYLAKFRFQNPIRQNFKHVCAVRELLDFLPADAIQPIVVFTGDAEFKTTIPVGVLSLESFLAYVEHQRAEVMSANRVHFCVGRLETARLSITQMTDVEHVQQLRKRYGNDEQHLAYLPHTKHRLFAGIPRSSTTLSPIPRASTSTASKSRIAMCAPHPFSVSLNCALLALVNCAP